MSRDTITLKVGILLRNRHDGPGGLEKVLDILAKAAPSQNLELYFYGLFKPKYTDFTHAFQNVHYLELPRPLQYLEKRVPRVIFRALQKGYVRLYGDKLFDQMGKDKIDALITMDLSKQFLQNFSFIKRFKEKFKIPVLSWVHLSLTGSRPHTAQKVKEKIHIFDAHLAISKGIADELKRDYQANNIALIYNPIDNASTVSRNSKRFIYIGRITKIKRVDSLLSHLQKLEGDWYLDIYGSTGSTTEDLKFNNLIQSLNLSENVNFHGWVSDPWENIPEAGVLLLNSTREGFGLVIVEAMMRGIPVISTDCPVGPSELIKNGTNGWLYGIDEENRMLSLLQNILDGDLDLPSQSNIQETVQKFETSNYIQNFTQQINLLIKN